MDEPDRLPLAQKALNVLIDQLRPDDLVRIHRDHQHLMAAHALARDAGALPWGALLGKGVRAVLLGKSSARQIWSPRFYRQLAAQRRRNRGRTDREGRRDAG